MLNIFVFLCGYGFVLELIVDNVDYMFDFVFLCFNIFDISFVLMRVLMMMIRLMGLKLVLFLEDMVQVVFVVLDNYYGYFVFVEGLFDVLGEVVMQGVKLDVLFFVGGDSEFVVDYKKRGY